MKEEISIISNKNTEKNSKIIELKKFINQCINEIIEIDEKISKIMESENHKQLKKELKEIDSDELQLLWEDSVVNKTYTNGVIDWLSSRDDFHHHMKIYKSIGNETIEAPISKSSISQVVSYLGSNFLLLIPSAIENRFTRPYTKNFSYEGIPYDECRRYVWSSGINSVDSQRLLKFNNEILQPTLGIYKSSYACKNNEFAKIEIYVKIKKIPKNQKRINEINEIFQEEKKYEILRTEKELELASLQRKFRETLDEKIEDNTDKVKKREEIDRFVSILQLPSLSLQDFSQSVFNWHIPVVRKTLYSKVSCKAQYLLSSTTFLNDAIVCSELNMLKLWDVHDINAPINSLSWGNGSKVWSLSTFDNMVVCGGADGTIKFWDLSDRTKTPSLITTVFHSPEEEYWQKKLGSHHKPKSSFSTILAKHFIFLSNKKIMISAGGMSLGSDGHVLRFWDISDIKNPICIKSLKSDKKLSRLIALSEDFFISVLNNDYDKKQTIFWNINDVIKHSTRLENFLNLIDTTTITFHDTNDIYNSILIHQHDTHDLEVRTIVSNNIIVCSRDGFLELWDIRDIKKLAKLVTWQSHEEAVWQTALISKNFLISMSVQGQLKIWDIRDIQKPVLSAICKGLQENILGSDFSLFTLPNGTICVNIGAGLKKGGFIKLWQPEKVLSLEEDKQSVEILNIDLSSFNLSINDEKTWQDFANYLKKYPHIKTLDFRYNALGKIDLSFLKTLANLLKNSTVKTIDVRENNFTDINTLINAYTEFEKNDIFLRFELELLEKIANKKKSLSICCLDFSYCEINDIKIKILTNILEKCDKNVFKLDLQGNLITELGVKELIKFIKEKNTYLNKINLSSNLIDTKGADSFLECDIHWMSESEFKDKSKNNNFTNSFIFIEDKKEFYYYNDIQVHKIEITSEILTSFEQDLKRKMNSKASKCSDYKEINRLLSEHKIAMPQAKTNFTTINISKNFIRDDWFSKQHNNLFQKGNLCSFFKNSKNVTDTSIVDKSSLISSDSCLIFLAREMRIGEHTRHAYLLMEWISNFGQHVLEKYDFVQTTSKSSQTESKNSDVKITNCGDEASRWLENTDKRAYMKWEATPESAKKMRLSIEHDKCNPPKYNLFNFNCFDWCMTKLNVIKDDINFDEKEIRENSVFPNPEWMIKN